MDPKIKPALVGLIIMLALLGGFFSGEVSIYEANSSGLSVQAVVAQQPTVPTTTTEATAAPEPTTEPTPEPTPTPVPTPTPNPIVTIASGDSPVLGDKNAPVTLIDFSDYECPYCKQHFREVFPTIKAKYIDTGKVKMVFRNFPLPSHDPLATREAIAAECAREDGGNILYFKFHDQLFNWTASNGKGLTENQLNSIASNIGLNMSNFKTCVSDSKTADKVQKDIADAKAAGVSNTPTFFIGKSDPSGTIQGEMLTGVHTAAAVSAVFDRYLKN